MAIPQEVREFITRRIDSVESLYVLMLLQRHPRLEWTGEAVGSELHIGPDIADQQLAKLCASNLLEVRVGKDLLYRYSPRPAFLDNLAQALTRAYGHAPSEVIEQIQRTGNSRGDRG